jgi:hypothetical protein
MYLCIDATVLQFITYNIVLSLQRRDREWDREHDIRQRADV